MDFPPPEGFLNALERTGGGLLPLIKDCLEKSNDHAADPSSRQPGYRALLPVDGLRQEGYTGTVSPGTASVPVVGTTLLTTLMDNFAGVALGYGTLDNPEKHADRYFYMVTNAFTLRPLTNDAANPQGIRVEMAALGEALPAPKALDIKMVEGLHQNRPMSQDGRATEVVDLTINAPAEPNSLGLLQSQPEGAKILNTNRGLGNNSYQPHIPNLPNRDNQVDHLIKYTVANSELPVAGSQMSTFGISSRDIFGRWSPFATANYTATALPAQRPGLIAVRLEYDPNSVDPGQATVRCRLVIQISWDWVERRPHAIEVSGVFFPADTELSAAPMTDRLSREATNLSAPPARITFTSSGEPQVAGAGLSVVQLDDTGPVPDLNLRKYRLVVDDVVATFPGPLAVSASPPATNPSRVAYGVAIRGLEAVRQSAGIMEWSDWSTPLRDVLDDPRPPFPLDLPAEVRWTALPDAANVARGKLTWPTVDRAVGYMVWQASESAIRSTLGLTFPEATTSYVDRATELERILTDPSNERASLRAFVRLNRDPLTATTRQIEMPGQSEVLYCYRVSAVTAAGLESPRSNAVFFAVPRQRKPSPPGIKVTAVTSDPPSLRIVTLPGPGTVPTGYRLYRIRNRLASNVVQMKGRPVYKENHIAWKAHQEPSLVGPAFDGMRLDDPVLPSWAPYYYQAVAVGPHDPSQGIYQAESAGSSTIEAYYFPTAAPVLAVQESLRQGSLGIIRLSTDGPLERVQGNSSRLEVYVNNDHDPAAARALILRGSLALGEVSSVNRSEVMQFSPAPNGQDVEVYKNLSHQEIYVRLRISVPTLIIRFTDPLGRTTESFITL